MKHPPKDPFVAGVEILAFALLTGFVFAFVAGTLIGWVCAS